ncbi:MAG: hypothetical protein ABW245_02350, partial [Gaiellaceae bacterium]
MREVAPPSGQLPPATVRLRSGEVVALPPFAEAASDAHLAAHPDDFVQGPLVREDGSLHSTHFEPVWEDGMFGRWALDDRVFAGAPFEIGMCGLGLFA